MQLYKIVEFSNYTELQKHIDNYTGAGYWDLFDVKLGGHGYGCVILKKIKAV